MAWLVDTGKRQIIDFYYRAYLPFFHVGIGQPFSSPTQVNVSIGEIFKFRIGLTNLYSLDPNEVRAIGYLSVPGRDVAIDAHVGWMEVPPPEEKYDYLLPLEVTLQCSFEAALMVNISEHDRSVTEQGTPWPRQYELPDLRPYINGSFYWAYWTEQRVVQAQAQINTEFYSANGVGNLNCGHGVPQALTYITGGISNLQSQSQEKCSVTLRYWGEQNFGFDEGFMAHSEDPRKRFHWQVNSDTIYTWCEADNEPYFFGEYLTTQADVYPETKISIESQGLDQTGHTVPYRIDPWPTDGPHNPGVDLNVARELPNGVGLQGRVRIPGTYRTSARAYNLIVSGNLHSERKTKQYNVNELPVTRALGFVLPRSRLVDLKLDPDIFRVPLYVPDSGMEFTAFRVQTRSYAPLNDTNWSAWAGYDGTTATPSGGRLYVSGGARRIGRVFPANDKSLRGARYLRVVFYGAVPSIVSLKYGNKTFAGVQQGNAVTFDVCCTSTGKSWATDFCRYEREYSDGNKLSAPAQGDWAWGLEPGGTLFLEFSYDCTLESVGWVSEPEKAAALAAEVITDAAHFRVDDYGQHRNERYAQRRLCVVTQGKLCADEEAGYIVKSIPAETVQKRTIAQVFDACLANIGGNSGHSPVWVTEVAKRVRVQSVIQNIDSSGGQLVYYKADDFFNNVCEAYHIKPGFTPAGTDGRVDIIAAFGVDRLEFAQGTQLDIRTTLVFGGSLGGFTAGGAQMMHGAAVDLYEQNGGLIDSETSSSQGYYIFPKSAGTLRDLRAVRLRIENSDHNTTPRQWIVERASYGLAGTQLPREGLSSDTDAIGGVFLSVTYPEGARIKYYSPTLAPTEIHTYATGANHYIQSLEPYQGATLLAYEHNGAIYIARSFNRGKTWTMGTFIGNGHSPCIRKHKSIAVLYIAYIRDGRIYMRTADARQTGDEQQVGSVTNAEDVTFEFLPRGDIVLFYTADGQVNALRSRDNGKTWQNF